MGKAVFAISADWRKYVADRIETAPRTYVCACFINRILTSVDLPKLPGRDHKAYTVKELNDAIVAFDAARSLPVRPGDSKP